MTPEAKISSETLGRACKSFWIRWEKCPLADSHRVLAENAIWFSILRSPSAADQKSLGVSSMEKFFNWPSVFWKTSFIRQVQKTKAAKTENWQMLKSCCFSVYWAQIQNSFRLKHNVKPLVLYCWNSKYMQFCNVVVSTLDKRPNQTIFTDGSFMPVIAVIRDSFPWPGTDSPGAGLAPFRAHATPTPCLPVRLCAVCSWSLCAIVQPNPRPKVTWRNEISKPGSAAGLKKQRGYITPVFVSWSFMVHVH